MNRQAVRLATPRRPLALIVAAVCGLGLTGACDPTVDSAPMPEPVVGPAANHNRIVGLYVGDGELPDGRAIRVELAADPNAYAHGQLTVDGTAHPFDNIPYDLRNGSLKLGTNVAVPVGGGTVMLHGVPAASGWTRLDFVGSAGTQASFEVNLARAAAPLGGDNRLSIVAASADANVTREPVVLGYLETRYAVPGPKMGDFSAHASPDHETSTRRFSLLMDELEFARDEIMVGTRVTFPNEDAQLNYNEEQPDGTIRQWTAVSGAVVFDAVDGEMVSQSGAESDFGLYTFHFDGLTLAPSNSTSDPRFVGALGTFGLAFSGTSSAGTKYLSR